MKTALVYPAFLADSEYNIAFNQNANFSHPNQRIIIKHPSDQDLSAVFPRYLRFSYIFPRCLYIIL